MSIGQDSFVSWFGCGCTTKCTVPPSDPNPHDDPYIAHVALGHLGKYRHCTDHRPHQRHHIVGGLLGLHWAFSWSIFCSPRPLFCSRGHIPDRMGELLLRRDAPKRAVLGRWLPLRLPRRAGGGFHVRIGDNVHLQGVAAVRTDRCGRAILCDDADRACDWPQLVHNRLQWGAQSAAEQPWCLRGPGIDEIVMTCHQQLSSRHVRLQCGQDLRLVFSVGVGPWVFGLQTTDVC